MRRLVCCSVALLAATAVLAPELLLARQRGDGICETHHPWGRFEPGAWKLVREVTESLDAQGAVVGASTTETKTTLMDIDDQGVTLEVAVVVEVAGKRFAKEPQLVRQGFHGEVLNDQLRVKEPQASQVTIEGQKLSCRNQQVEIDGPSGKTVVGVWYSDTVEPFILRREASTTSPDGAQVLSQTTTEVVALAMPWKVLAEMKSAALIRTVHRHAKGVTTTWAFASADVPGGIVSHTSKETDESGRLIRRSTLELIDYGRQCEPTRAGLFPRKRRAR